MTVRCNGDVCRGRYMLIYFMDLIEVMEVLQIGAVFAVPKSDDYER